jgi:hypothetical protein
VTSSPPDGIAAADTVPPWTAAMEETMPRPRPTDDAWGWMPRLPFEYRGTSAAHRFFTQPTRTGG